MTIQTLVSLLTEAKFDVHLESAPDGTACPYVVLEDLTQPNFAADNGTYTEITSLRLTLVESEVHDWTLINTLKGVALNSAYISDVFCVFYNNFKCVWTRFPGVLCC